MPMPMPMPMVGEIGSNWTVPRLPNAFEWRAQMSSPQVWGLARTTALPDRCKGQHTNTKQQTPQTYESVHTRVWPYMLTRRMERVLVGLLFKVLDSFDNSLFDRLARSCGQWSHMFNLARSVPGHSDWNQIKEPDTLWYFRSTLVLWHIGPAHSTRTLALLN